MDKFTHLAEFVQYFFDEDGIAQKATEIIKGILRGRSPRMSDIAREMAGTEAANYKQIQRFVSQVDTCAALLRLFQDEAPFMIGDPTEMPRPQAKRTDYVGTLSDGETSRYWLLFLATPYRGRAIPCHFVSYSSKTIHQLATSHNQYHFKAFSEVKELLGEKPLALDRVSSYLELMENMVKEGVNFVIRLKEGAAFYDNEGKPVNLSIAKGETRVLNKVFYKGKVFVNVIGVWREGFSRPMWVMTNLKAEDGLSIYLQRMKIEIVFTQMTKTDMFASWAGGNHISDLDIFILNDHSINEQFYQFPLLFKAGVFQSRLDTAAKILDGSSQTGEFISPVYLMHQLLFQVLHALEFTIQICSSSLILGQRNDLIQVGFCEPIQLGLHSELSPT
jgi:hypothetical protein